MNHKRALHLSFHSGSLYRFDTLVSLSICCAIWTVCPVKHNIASVWMRMCMLLLCPCFANSLENECIHSFTGHFLFTYTVLPTLRGTVKGVLLTSNINCVVHFTKRIDVSSHIYKITLTTRWQKPLFWTLGCFYISIDQRRYLLLISPLHYYFWWIDWQPVARDQFVSEHWTLSEKSTIMSQSWTANNPRGCVCLSVCG